MTAMTRRRASSVSTMNSLRTGSLRNRALKLLADARDFFFFMAFRQALASKQPPTQLMPRVLCP